MAADYVKKIRTLDGDKQIDYRALANKPCETGENGAALFSDATEGVETALASGGYMTIAVDVSGCAGSWATDGIAIAVFPELRETFDNLEYVYVTYQGNLLKLKRSNFYTDNETFETQWPTIAEIMTIDDPRRGYWIYWYNNADFDFMAEGLVMERLDPISCYCNVFEVTKSGEIKSPTIDALFKQIGYAEAELDSIIELQNEILEGGD